MTLPSILIVMLMRPLLSSARGGRVRGVVDVLDRRKGVRLASHGYLCDVDGVVVDVAEGLGKGRERRGRGGRRASACEGGHDSRKREKQKRKVWEYSLYRYASEPLRVAKLGGFRARFLVRLGVTCGGGEPRARRELLLPFNAPRP